MRQDGGETPSVVSILLPPEEARKVEDEPSSKNDGGGTSLRQRYRRDLRTND